MKQIILTFFLTLILINSTGCTTPPQNESIKIGITKGIPSQALYLARTLGYYLPEEIELNPVQTETELLKALSNGSIDAATVTLDQANKMMKTHNTFNIVLLMGVPKGMVEISESYQDINVLIMRKSILEKHPQKVASLMGGWYSTLVYIDQHPKQTVEFFSQQMKMDPNTIHSQISSMRWGTETLNKEFSFKLMNN